MTEKEALKLALEALENIKNDPFKFDLKNGIDKAITAIKKTLANDALEKKAENAKELGLDYEPDKNEFKPDWDEKLALTEEVIRLSKRTWIGLTKKEFQEAVEGVEDLEDCWVAIESALRSKNHG